MYFHGQINHDMYTRKMITLTAKCMPKPYKAVLVKHQNHQTVFQHF